MNHLWYLIPQERMLSFSFRIGYYRCYRQFHHISVCAISCGGGSDIKCNLTDHSSYCCSETLYDLGWRTCMRFEFSFAWQSKYCEYEICHELDLEINFWDRHLGFTNLGSKRCIFGRKQRINKGIDSFLSMSTKWLYWREKGRETDHEESTPKTAPSLSDTSMSLEPRGRKMLGGIIDDSDSSSNANDESSSVYSASSYSTFASPLMHDLAMRSSDSETCQNVDFIHHFVQSPQRFFLFVVIVIICCWCIMITVRLCRLSPSKGPDCFDY